MRWIETSLCDKGSIPAKKAGVLLFLKSHLNKVLTMLAEGIDDEKLKDYLRETTMLQIHLEGKLND